MFPPASMWARFADHLSVQPFRTALRNDQSTPPKVKKTFATACRGGTQTVPMPLHASTGLKWATTQLGKVMGREVPAPSLG